jgi:hypothetical protein
VRFGMDKVDGDWRISTLVVYPKDEPKTEQTEE